MGKHNPFILRRRRPSENSKPVQPPRLLCQAFGAAFHAPCSTDTAAHHQQKPAQDLEEAVPTAASVCVATRAPWSTPSVQHKSERKTQHQTTQPVLSPSYPVQMCARYCTAQKNVMKTIPWSHAGQRWSKSLSPAWPWLQCQTAAAPLPPLRAAWARGLPGWHAPATAVQFSVRETTCQSHRHQPKTPHVERALQQQPHTRLPRLARQRRRASKTWCCLGVWVHGG